MLKDLRCDNNITPEGIVNGNDVYMYGEKLKSALNKGAVQLPGQPVQSSVTGWGALCLQNSIPRG